MVNDTLGGLKTSYTNFSASGMNVFDTPTLEYFHISFTDKWGDAVDVPSYSIGFEFMVAERTPISQPETIFRARQKLMDIS